MALQAVGATNELDMCNLACIEICLVQRKIQSSLAFFARTSGADGSRSNAVCIVPSIVLSSQRCVEVLCICLSCLSCR